MATLSSFSDQQISNWANAYEKELSAKYNLIADRYQIPIISGQNAYEIPNWVTNIRMVLYLGKNVYPKGFRSSYITGDIPFQTSNSFPYEYVFGGFGQRVLKFYPTPGNTIVPYIGDLFSINADKNCCIIEFYRTPSLTDINSSGYVGRLSLPSWVRRHLLKDYICMKAFEMEGPQQDIRAAQYYQDKILGHEMILSKIKENMNLTQFNVIQDNPKSNLRKPGRPVLPPNFGFPANY